MNVNAALTDIKSFLLEAGTLALRVQAHITTQYKKGDQAVTEADIAISKLAQTRLSHWFKQDRHALLDEESIDQAGSPEEVFASSTYQWALDPIDGTAGYALGRNLWGISLGVLHDGIPLLGGIYLPAIREMLLVDDKKAWRIQNFSTPHENILYLACKDMNVNSQTFVESYYGAKHGWGDSSQGNKIWMNTPESAVQGFFSALTGQAAGAVTPAGYSVWDVSAAYAMANRAGFAIRSMTDGRACEKFTAKDFRSNWGMADCWLLCANKNFQYIRSGITGKE